MWARAEEVLPSWRSIAPYESSSCLCIYSTLSSSSMCREWHTPSKNKHSESALCLLNSLSNDGGKKLESSFQVSKHRKSPSIETFCYVHLRRRSCSNTESKGLIHFKPQHQSWPLKSFHHEERPCLLQRSLRFHHFPS